MIENLEIYEVRITPAEETKSHFRARVKDLTGCSYEHIPFTEEADYALHPIACRRKNVVVVLLKRRPLYGDPSSYLRVHTG